MSDTPRRRRSRRITDHRKHGHWLHFPDPNICSECYLRGNLAGEVDVVITRNAVGEYMATSDNEISPIAFAMDEDGAMVYSIGFLEDTEQLPWFPDAAITRTAIRNQFADFGVPWQLAEFRHDVDDCCLAIDTGSLFH